MRSKLGTTRKVVALVAVGLLALTACGTAKAKKDTNLKAEGYGSLPAAAGTATTGGTVTFAQNPGSDPNWIFPLTPSANSSVYIAYQWQYLMWRPIYWSPNGSAPEINQTLSMASKATVSPDGKTFTIKLDGKYTWSDGKPVTATDVIFYVDLYKAAVKESAANSGNYTPGQFPDNVTSLTSPDPNTLVFTFDKVYNPTWVQLTELNQLFAFPTQTWAKSSATGPQLDFTQPANAKAIYDFLAGQSKDLKTYATNPLWQTVDGPFKIKTYNTSTGASNLVVNTAYTGAVKPKIAELDELSYTSTTAEFNDLRSGKLDVGFVDFSDLPQVPQLQAQHYNVYGLPDFGFEYIAFNFKDTTGDWNNIVKQLYVRQAIAHLQDQDGYVKGLFKGAAAVAFGPVPAIPASPFAPANAKTNPYPYSIAAAKKLLTDHGWTVVPGGQTTCTSPGTAANQCGDGIPAGTALKFDIVYSNSPAVIGQQDEALASAAKQVGITITTTPKTFNYIIENYGVPEAPANNNKWAAEDFGGFTQGLYPSTDNLFNTGGSYNQGGYSDPTADQLIQASLTSTDPDALQKEAAYITQQVPAIFQPNPDLIWAWKPTISGPSEGFSNLTQYTLTPEYWYITK